MEKLIARSGWLALRAALRNPNEKESTMTFVSQPIGRRLVLTSAACAAVIGSSTAGRAQPSASAQPSGSAQDIREIAAAAYIYLYPLVTMGVTQQQTNALPGTPLNSLSNKFVHMRTFPPADFKVVVRSNFDTLYSTAWLDLAKEPMIVSVPDTAGRYYVLPMLDMWTDVFAAPGKRTSGTAAGHFAVVPPGWSGNLPRGLTRINAPTPSVWIVGRTQTNGPQDYAAVHKIQDGYTVMPLSQWGRAPIQGQAAVSAPAHISASPPQVLVDRMAPLNYFKYAAELMKTNPPHLTDWSAIERLKRIGIEAGHSYDPERLDPAIQEALTSAVAAGQKIMHAKAETLGTIVNGWQMDTDAVGVYGDYYLKRAVVAQILLTANQPEDAVYPLIVTDADGKPPVGENKYVLHFDKSGVPPVEAFWSLSMYDADGFQVANPINRFALGDRDMLKYNADGSLDLYIQHDHPGADRAANWLPSPAAGVLGLTMRLYAPRPEVLDGSWAPPPLRRQS
jgi:hypothetical protein